MGKKQTPPATLLHPEVEAWLTLQPPDPEMAQRRRELEAATAKVAGLRAEHTATVARRGDVDRTTDQCWEEARAERGRLARLREREQRLHVVQGVHNIQARQVGDDVDVANERTWDAPIMKAVARLNSAGHGVNHVTHKGRRDVLHSVSGACPRSGRSH